MTVTVLSVQASEGCARCSRTFYKNLGCLITLLCLGQGGLNKNSADNWCNFTKWPSLTCNYPAYILNCRLQTSYPSSPSSAHWRSLWVVWRQSTSRTRTEEEWSGCPDRSSSSCLGEGNFLDLSLPSGAVCLPSSVCLAEFHRVFQTLDVHCPPSQHCN